MLGPSFDIQGQLGRWTYSHGDCMSHLNLGSVMRKNYLALLPPVTPSIFHLNFDPSALPCQSLGLHWLLRTRPHFLQELKDDTGTNPLLPRLPRTDQQIPYLMNIGSTWSFCSGEGSQRKVIPGHSQKRQRRQSTPLLLAGPNTAGGSTASSLA